VVHLKDVSPDALKVFQKLNHPVTVFALHKHEHKFTVMHFSVLRNTEYEQEVRSKDPVILLLGPRRFLIEPVFSQHTQRNGGKGTNNVHKFHRFAQQGTAAVASAYLPVTFGSNTPALLLQPESLDLISSGSLMSSDPTRVIAKRVILTGHPYKLHKRTATIRYMFFNTDDIHYFKPIELHTKKGRKGHIKESLGTHGFFKASFDGPMDQMDTVCLNLYKRCFPKWGKLLKEDGQAMGGDVEMAS
jgi:pre-rRNA-processing protein TSR1